jgi:hypothetical protein
VRGRAWLDTNAEANPKGDFNFRINARGLDAGKP